MLKQQEEKRLVLTPFVVAYPNGRQMPGTSTGKSKQPGAHLTREDATKEVLNRIVDRVKRI